MFILPRVFVCECVQVCALVCMLMSEAHTAVLLYFSPLPETVSLTELGWLAPESLPSPPRC